MALPLNKDQRVTYADYLTWPDQERWEIIDGVPYAMTPSPSREHQKVLKRLVYRIEDYLKDKPCELYFAPFDVRIPVADEDDQEMETVVQPDIIVVCDQTKLDEKGCKGAPNLVIEIISPGSAALDMKIKFNLYEKAGVKEYWIIDPLNRTVLVYHSGPDQKYGKPEVYVNEDIIKTALFSGFEIKLSEVFS